MINRYSGNQDELKEKGRMKFFYHCSDSLLPIRDVTNSQKKNFKTEPHIEIGAENYINCCYQNYIKSTIKNNEKYVFWITTCKNPSLVEFNKRLIVGYLVIDIEKSTNITEKRFCLFGKPFIFDFKDSILVQELGYNPKLRKQLVDEEYTKKILKHFKNKKNIINECIEEIKVKDFKNITCHRFSSNFQCKNLNRCLRWTENEGNSK